MFQIEIDGNDIVVKNVIATAFGGGYDTGDNGQTESGVTNDGSNPNLFGCALPIRSTENATKNSPLANAKKPHIPWGTTVRVWVGENEIAGIDVTLIDNGPDVSKYPTHGLDLTVAAARIFAPEIPLEEMANKFEKVLSYRVKDAAQYVTSN